MCLQLMFQCFISRHQLNCTLNKSRVDVPRSVDCVGGCVFQVLIVKRGNQIVDGSLDLVKVRITILELSLDFLDSIDKDVSHRVQHVSGLDDQLLSLFNPGADLSIWCRGFPGFQKVVGGVQRVVRDVISVT